MPDEVQGLSASITADASDLLSVLTRTEQALRQFDSRFGHINVQIAATLQQPSRETLRAFQTTVTQGFQREGPLRIPVALIEPSHDEIQRSRQAVEAKIAAAQTSINRPAGVTAAQVAQSQTPLTDAALKTHDAQLATQINAASTVATRSTREAIIQRTVAGPPVAADTGFNEGEARAQAQARANSTGRAVQYNTASGGIGRVFPTGGGPVGGAGRESFGGVALPPGARGITGAFGPNGENLNAIQEELARTQSELRRVQSQVSSGGLSPAQVAQRQAAGLAGAAAVDRDPLTGRFVPRQPVATTQPPIQRFNAAAIANEIQATAGKRAEVMAVNALLGVPVATLESWEPGFLQKTIVGLKSASGPQFDEAYRNALDELQTGGRGTPFGSGRQIVLPEARADITARTPELQAARAAIEQSQQAGFVAQQVRPSSPRVAAARAFGGLLGVSDVQELERQRSQQETRLRQFTEIQTGAIAKRESYEQSLQERELKGLPITQQHIDQLDKFQRAETDASKAVSEQTTVLEAATKAVAGAGGPLRGFAASFAGGVTGGLAFGAAIQLVGGALGLVDKAISPVIERLTGYQNVASHLTDTLSDQTRQAHGQVDVVLAQAEAQANLNAVTAASIQPIIAQRTAGEAANKAISDQLDLFNSAIAIRRQNQQFGGFDRSLFQTTGGLNILGVQTPLFGTPSTSELLGRQLQQPAQNAGTNIAGRVPGLFGNLLANPLDINGTVSRFMQDSTQGVTDALNNTKDSISYFNEQLKKGGESTLQFALTTNKADQAEANRQADIFKTIGASDSLVDAFRQGTVLVRGLTTSDQARRLLQAYQTGGQFEDPSLVLQRLRAQTIPARMFQIAAQSQLQGQLATAGIGIAAAQQPLIPFGTGIPGGFGAVSPGIRNLIGPTQNFDRIQVQQIQAAQVQIQQIASANGLLPQAGQQALQDFGTIRAAGQQIAGIQAGVTQEQANYQVAQFNEQLRVAVRSRTDLLQLTRQEGAVQGDNLGLLERQSIELGRQSDQLSLQLTALQQQIAQRRINFQVAVAGFAGGAGATPEERAARREEALQEASFAQKQLDIQKQQLVIQRQQVPISFRIQDVGFQRQLTDITHQIGLIRQGIQVTVDTAAADEAIAHIQAGMQAAQADLQRLLQQGQAVISGLIGDAAQYIATYKTSTQTLEQSAADFFSGIGSSFATALSKYVTGAAASVSAAAASLGGGGLLGGQGPGYGGNPNPVTGPHQTGYLGNVNRATRMTVGEAGNETVAILRNPREMMWGSSGGGGQPIQINISVTGNQVRSDEDISKLTREIARSVEESLARKTSLLGFRIPSPS